MPEHELGRYTGRLILQPLPDGRRMRVIEDFGFMEADGLHWPVPPQSTVDGASIPQVLWSLIGGPFEGKYRDASVVHDYYCAVRSADCQSVHRMFYRAMLVSGVSVRRAKVMYAAVYFAGPRWDDLVVHNVLLGPPAVPSRPVDDDRLSYKRLASSDNRLFYTLPDATTLTFGKVIDRDGILALDWDSSLSLRSRDDICSEITLRLDKLFEIVERDDPSLRTLETGIDRATRLIPGAKNSPRGVSIGHLSTLD